MIWGGFNIRKLVGGLSIVVGMLLLLYLLTTSFWEVREAMEKGLQSEIPLLKMSLWAFVFGMLMEWRGLNQIFVHRKIKINWLLAPAVLLGIVSFIPRVNWLIWFHTEIPFFIEMLFLSETQILLTAFSGLLLVRALAEKEN